MRLWILALVLVIAPGCVGKKKYVQLESDYASLVDRNNQLESEKQADREKMERLAQELREGESGDDAELKRLKAALERLQSKFRQAQEAARELKVEMEPLIARGLLEIEVVDGRIVLGMSSDVLFAPGSATLSEQGVNAVTQVSTALGRRTERDFQVEGHTDNQPIATEQFPSNWYLGAARAITVTRTMIAAGMPADRISAASFAATQPSASNDTDIGRARNRRIEIVLLPDLSDLPGFDGKPVDLPVKEDPPPEIRPEEPRTKTNRPPRRSRGGGRQGR